MVAVTTIESVISFQSFTNNLTVCARIVGDFNVIR